MIEVSQLASLCESQSGIKPGRLSAKTRKEEYVTARRLFAYFCQIYGISDREALQYVDVDRTTFYYLKKSAEDMYVYDREFYELVRKLDDNIKALIGANKYKRGRVTLEDIGEKLDMIIRHLGI